MSIWDPTRSNINHIREQIIAKTDNAKPFLPSLNAVQLSVTDRDTFPYTRNYRGISSSFEPVILEREAGWRPRHDPCYNPIRQSKKEIKEFCWQIPCSTTLPCNAIHYAGIQSGCVIISD